MIMSIIAIKDSNTVRIRYKKGNTKVEKALQNLIELVESGDVQIVQLDKQLTDEIKTSVSEMQSMIEEKKQGKKHKTMKDFLEEEL